jgi:hypothetical protein
MIALLLALISSMRAAQSPGAPQDSAPATLPGVEVTEWSIFVCDPVSGRANPARTIQSALPQWIESVRPPVKGTPRGPSPIGIIRFSGQTDQKIKVRLTAPTKAVCYAAWPPARLSSQEIVWKDLTLSTIPGQREKLEADHWFAPLQNASHTYLVSGDKSEAFLLYDIELPFTVPLMIYPGKATDGIQVESFGGAPLHDLVIYRPPHDGAGWTTGSLAEVAAKLPGGPVAAATEIALAAPANGADHPEEMLAADWKERLRPWQLDPADSKVIINVLQAHALDDRQLTAIFRLDESVLNQLLPLEISPAPARVRRLALVIVRNIDPALPALIDQLITQLGDPDWHARETASRLLAGYAPAADSKLRSAMQSKDAEVALRAERLLARDSR